jgi:hypothetical protein
MHKLLCNYNIYDIGISYRSMHKGKQTCKIQLMNAQIAKCIQTKSKYRNLNFYYYRGKGLLLLLRIRKLDILYIYSVYQTSTFIKTNVIVTNITK